MGGEADRNDIAVIDIGSNSVRLVIYQTFGAHFTPVFNEKVLAGLGRDLRKTGRLSVTGREDCLQALMRFQRIMRARNISKFLVGATAALRVAEDAPEFLAEIKLKTGWDIVPVSGAEEARLSAMGVLALDKRHAGLAADLGGASLELIQISAGQVGDAVSLPLGPFDVVEKDLSELSEPDFTQISHIVDGFIADLSPNLLSAKTLFLVGGAWRNLASVHQQRTSYPMKTLQDYTLGYDDTLSLAQWAFGEGRNDLLKWSGMRRARAETLPYSGVILERLLLAIKPERVVISISGLREGLVFDSLPPETQAKDALFDGCRDFAYGAVQTEDFGEPLLELMMPLLQTLPSVFTSVFSEDPNNLRMAKAASLLAGLGKNLHDDHRPELVFNDVLYAPVAGLTHPERAFLALTLLRSYSRKSKVPNAEAITSLLSEDQINSAGILGEIIRLAIVATGHSPSLVQAIKLSREGNQIILSVRESEKALITEQVLFRLSRLGKLLDCDVATKVI